MENHMRLSGSPLSTQKTYIRPVRDLMEVYGALPETLTADQIKAHLATFRGKLSSSALNLRVCGIKYYFKYVVKRLDLVVDIPNPRLAKYVQEVLREDELWQLFDACTSMRERAMLLCTTVDSAHEKSATSNSSILTKSTNNSRSETARAGSLEPCLIPNHFG